MRDEETHAHTCWLSSKTSTPHLELPTSRRHTRLNGSLIPDKDRRSPWSGFNRHKTRRKKIEGVEKERELKCWIMQLDKKMLTQYGCIPEKVGVCGGRGGGEGGLRMDGTSDRMMMGADQSPKLFFQGGKGWLINGFRPPGETLVELPVLFSCVASNCKKFHDLFLEKKMKIVQVDLNYISTLVINLFSVWNPDSKMLVPCVKCELRTVFGGLLII